MNGSAGRVALGHTSSHVGREFVLGGHALVQALAGDGRAFGFDRVKPGGILGRIMHLEALGQRVGPGGGQVLVEDGIGVGVEVVLDQHDFLRLRVGRR